ncbi:MAG: hypothetical protein AABX66_04035 [Nanoarchaeota archaeon]|mgnify:CR=1 FL=1
MKNTLRNLVCAVPLALALTSCSHRDEFAKAEISSKNALSHGNSRVLKINVSGDGVSYASEVRFYDTDGDGKTVEDYVVCVHSGTFPIAKTNLVRDAGQKQSFGTFGARVMTDKEKERIDGEYQHFLEYLSKKF